jgi:RNA ligase (TIGR02306 family)
MRKLATLRRISILSPIEGADAIECAHIDGWKVVVKKNEYTPSQLVVYLEIDSWVPHELAPFLSKGACPREYNGIKGERLRTVKLRGQISQGLVLPITVVPTFSPDFAEEGQDLTDILNVQKWEADIPAQLRGTVKGSFPSFIRKTDQERVQNLRRDLTKWTDLTWEVTEKLDGSSCTVYWNDGHLGVCSRNLELKEDEQNTFWKVVKDAGLDQLLGKLEMNIALQGEVFGEGIQGNPYKVRGQRIRIFDIFDIDSGQYIHPLGRRAFCEKHGIPHAPVLHEEFMLPHENAVDTLLEMAEGKSVYWLTTEREGLVFKSNTPEPKSFKAISNQFLLKGGQ